MSMTSKLAGLAVVAVAVLALGTRSASAQGYGYGGGGNGGGGWWAYHNNLTFEASIGLGYLNAHADGHSDSEWGVAGVNLGIGGFLGPQVALTLREASVTYFDNFNDGSNIAITSMFLGPSVQYWATPQFFVGGGAGLALARAYFGDSSGGLTYDSDSGFGLDIRAGFSFSQFRRRSWNLQVEVTPAFYGDVTLTGVSFQLGYQWL